MSSRGRKEATTARVKGPPRSAALDLTMTVGYLTLWGILLYFVYRYFKKPKITEESYFGLNKERHTYVESVRILDKLEGDDGDGNDGKSKAYREQLEQCRKALMRRAMTCVRRLWKLHADRDSVYALMRAGSIDEVVWQQFKAAENHLQMEIYDIQAESETFKDGWSQAILREAAELCRKEDQLTEMLKTVNKRQQKQPKPAPSTATSPSSNNGGSIVVEEVSDEDD